MKTLFITASFLAPVHKSDLLKTDQYTYVLREERKNNASKLYSLFFAEHAYVKKPEETEPVAADPYYFCDYE